MAAGALLPMVLRSAQFSAAEFAGAAIGIGLGVWGAQRTRFLMDGGQLYYVPHTYTGIAVSLLFLSRLAYRVLQNYTGATSFAGAANHSPASPASLVSSPLTVGIVFVLVGYYGLRGLPRGRLRRSCVVIEGSRATRRGLLFRY